jgi:hypothetical protein
MTKNTIETSFPIFPTDIIQGVAKEFVELYSPIRETPESFLWLVFLTYFGNAISPYVRLDCASSEPRFYSVVIGKSGRTRKSAGNNVAREFFKLVEAKGQVIIEGFGSAEGVLAILGDSPTPKSAVLYLDEMNILASKTDVAGSIGIAGLHKLFEDHDYDHPLKSRKDSLTVRNAFLSLMGASTLEDFTSAWSAKHKDAGFFSRLFLVAGDAEKRIPRPADPDSHELHKLARKVKELISSVISNPSVLKMDLDAEEIWAKFYETFGVGPEWNRIDTYGFRLMAVQATLREEPSVTKANVQQVIDLLQYEVAVREAVSPVIGENSVAQMEELIRRFLPEGKIMTKRALQRATNYNRCGIEVFERAINNLIRNEEISVGRKAKSILYTRVCVDNAEAMSPSESVIESVFAASEDTKTSQNINEHAPVAQSSSNCHQISVQPHTEMIM